MYSFVKEFLRQLKKQESTATIILLKGNLGSGKTTFTKAAARELGITEHITSPTFVIQKEYTIPDNKKYKTLIHIDAYRLENKEDLHTLDWERISNNPENIIFLEWPEIVGMDTFNKKVTIIVFEYLDENTRKLDVLQ